MDTTFLKKIGPAQVGMISDPTKRAWENVVLKGIPPDEKIRPEILRSWMECLEANLDPGDSKSLPILPQKRLELLIEKNSVLLEASRHVVDMLEITVRDTGFIVTLAEKKGYVIISRGDEDTLRKAKQTSFQPGCLRKSVHSGTNAIGLCLTERKPVQVTGAEHFKLHHHPWTCSSAPIFDGNGRFIGVITLSGRSTNLHLHTLALVTAASETINSHLREQDLIEEKQRLNSMLPLILNTISDGVIAVDGSLCITHLNSRACHMLGIKVESSLKKPIYTVVKLEEPFMEALQSRQYFRRIETTIICSFGYRNFICSADPVRNNSGHILGTIISLSEKQEMIRIAKNIGGNYAKYHFQNIRGNNSELLKQIKLAEIASRTNSRVLITGESGTGKELFAQAIHNSSSRKNEPFVAISCAAIPRDLIESELFGYRRGAFTGARQTGHVGKFELANKGTLFLDEVDGLPLDLQAKLLRVLQEEEIMRLGDTRTIPIDVRLIASSNLDLMAEVEADNFREDLYYRLNVVEIYVPPLRNRIDDLDLLIDHFLNRLCHETGSTKPKISDEVLEVLRSYRWPGNVRELENCIERALLLSEGNFISISHLPDRIIHRHSDSHRYIPLKQGLKEIIESTMKQCNGNISMAARELNISRSTLYRKMKELRLSR